MCKPPCKGFCALCSVYPIILLTFAKISVWICVMPLVLRSSQKHLRDSCPDCEVSCHLSVKTFGISKLCSPFGLITAGCPDVCPIPQVKDMEMVLLWCWLCLSSVLAPAGLFCLLN